MLTSHHRASCRLFGEGGRRREGGGTEVGGRRAEVRGRTEGGERICQSLLSFHPGRPHPGPLPEGEGGDGTRSVPATMARGEAGLRSKSVYDSLPGAVDEMAFVGGGRALAGRRPRALGRSPAAGAVQPRYSTDHVRYVLQMPRTGHSQGRSAS